MTDEVAAIVKHVHTHPGINEVWPSLLDLESTLKYGDLTLVSRSSAGGVVTLTYTPDECKALANLFNTDKKSFLRTLAKKYTDNGIQIMGTLEASLKNYP